MLLLTAANGNQGRLLLPKLLRAGAAVRGIVRSEASAEAIRRAGVGEVVVGDITDPDVLNRALDGVDQVYHIGPMAHPREREMGFRMVDAAVRHGIGHLVFSSVLHSLLSALVQHELKRDIEEHLIGSGLEYTILQPTNYMAPWRMIPPFRDGVFRLFWALDRKQSMVDIEDVTDVAARVLIERERHYGATYELCGAERYDAHEIGAIIAQVTGTPIAVEEVDVEEYGRGLFGDADPARFALQMAVLRSISAYNGAHDFVGNPNVLTWLLGRAPTTFGQFAAREYAAYRAAAT